MNRICKRLLRLALLVAVVPASPALAWDYDRCFFGTFTWNSSSVAMGVSTVSFPPGSFIRDAFDAAAAAWNAQAPGTNFRFLLSPDPATSFSSGDGKNSVLFTSDYSFNGALAVAVTRRNCTFTSKITEADIYYNPEHTWSIAPFPFFPVSPFSPFNLTLVGLHELGHAFGLQHEGDTLATMNAFYPNGGTLGNFNAIQPHADDLAGNRSGYGTCCTARDLAASTYLRTGADTSNWIPAPAVAFRGHPTSFQFTIENRGTETEPSARVQFYLSTDRFIDTSDTLLGAATFSLGWGTSSTFTATVNVPTTQTPGEYFLGYVVDPLGSVPEVDEQNNAVALTARTQVPSQSPPVACFTLFPQFGSVPHFVSFDATCSSDPDGGPLTYSWDFGNGTTGTGAFGQAVYDSQGSYTVWLTVTDAQGLSSAALDLVGVSCEPGAFCPQEP